MFDTIEFKSNTTNEKNQNLTETEKNEILEDILSLKEQNKLEEAKVKCELLVKQNKDDFLACNLLGLIFMDQGKYYEAEIYIKNALTADPNNYEILNNLGVLFVKQHKYKLAINYFEQTKSYVFNEGISNNLANAYFNNDDFIKSAEEYELILSNNPKSNVYFNLANVYLKLNKKHDVIRVAELSFKYFDETLEMLNLMGLTQKLLGNLKKAAIIFHKAIKKFPNNCELYNNLGIVQYQLGYVNLSCSSYREAIKIKPNNADVFVNLGNAEQKLGRIFHAIECFKKALSIEERTSAYNNLGNAYGRVGENTKAINSFKRAMDIQLFEKKKKNSFSQDLLVDTDVISNYLCHLDYIQSFSAKEIFDEHIKVSKYFYKNHKKINFTQEQLKKNNQKLRIGFVSPDFKAHSVANFFLPIISSYDKSKYELFCYYNDTPHDKVTTNIASFSSNFKKIYGLSNSAVINLIQKDKINILVDLGGHFANNRIPLFAEKPAPITVTYLGYPNTSGLPNMDYRFTTESADPTGISDKFYTEKLIRLEKNFLCYNGPENIYKTNYPPSKVGNKISFGSFNNILKVSDFTIQAWSNVLKEVPNSDLFIKSTMRINNDVSKVFLNKFSDHGIDINRIKIIETTNTNLEHMKLYNSIDIALDTFPFNGATTTFEALWMGVPVMTIKGTKHAGRVSTSILDTIEMYDCISEDINDFVIKSSQLANNLDQLIYYKQNLRENLKNSDLTNKVSFTKKIETEFEKMWLKIENRGQ